jgi:hypothetical protein
VVAGAPVVVGAGATVVATVVAGAPVDVTDVGIVVVAATVLATASPVSLVPSGVPQLTTTNAIPTVRDIDRFMIASFSHRTPACLCGPEVASRIDRVVLAGGSVRVDRVRDIRTDRAQEVGRVKVCTTTDQP